MASIVRQLPFSDRATTVQVGGGSFPVLPNQVVVWVSLGRAGQRTFDPRTPRLPAVLDTGFTDNFLIHEQQLRQFAGLDLQWLTRYPADLRAQGRRIAIHMAYLSIHCNRPGERDTFTRTMPFLLEPDRGIGVCSDPDAFPRLPLLGARALRKGRLELRIDYGRCRVALRSPSPFWFLNWW
jgi:hypothetical protein